MDFSNQFNAIQNSVIRILAVQVNAANQPVVLSSGSGVLVGDGTHALTCRHCVIANTIILCFVSGQENGVIGTLTYSNDALDIAIIRFPHSLGAGATIKDSNGLMIGNEGFVAGFPMFSNTITALSAHISGFEMINGTNYIKIDASVNHGNSGGPLFNSDGQVIGIINAKKGNISDLLNQIEQLQAGGGVFIDGIDPILIIKELIKQMKTNLNLGIGSAIPTRSIGDATDLIGNVIV